MLYYVYSKGTKQKKKRTCYTMKTYEKVNLKTQDLGKTYNKDWKQDVFAYNMTLSRNGKQATFKFFTGTGWDKAPSVKDLLGSLVRDYNFTLEELIDDLGYSYNEGSKIFATIQRNNEKLDKLFSSAEIVALQTELEDY